MDSVVKAIVDYVQSTRVEDMPDAATRAMVRNYLDSVGCAAGGFLSRPAGIARSLAARAGGGAPAASALGLAEPTLVELAVFANAVATRYADYNDVEMLTGSGHPSDMCPAIVAAAEVTGCSGREAITAMNVAYEVVGAIGRQVPLRDRGWDQGLMCSIGVAAGLSWLYRLDAAQTANALSIAITPSIPLRVARAGELSDWKGAATAHATMTATFAVRLAQAGMTGPGRPFEGIEAAIEKVTGPFELRDVGVPVDGKHVSETVQHKYFPVIAEAQSPVQLSLELREKFDIDELESMTLTTEYLGWHEGGGGQGDRAEKWDPKTRETADHSLPYVMAAALVDGRLTMESFAPERLSDPALRPIMKRIEVREDPEYTARRAASGELVAVIDVELRDGFRLHAEANHPRGHWKNPMTDAEINSKFDSMITKVLPRSEAMELRELLWHLPDQPDVHQIAAHFRRFGQGS